MEARLKIDGDDLEKVGWDLFIQDKFPNYEKFWQQFVVPRRRKGSIHHKADLPMIEKEIIMLHYAIFRHLFFIYNNLDSLERLEDFESRYIRLVSVLDIVEEFLIKLLTLSKKLNLSDEFLGKFSKEELHFDTTRAKETIEKGKNYTLPLLSKIEIIKKIVDNERIRDFEKFARKVREYRNQLIHSWPRFHIYTPAGILIIRKELVNDKTFREWANVLEEMENNPSFVKNNFIPIKGFIQNDADHLCVILNDIWEIALEMIHDENTGN